MTDMKFEKDLAEKIEQLLEIIPEDNRNSIERLIGEPLWKKIELSHECAKLIINDTRFKIFDDHMQYLGSSCRRISYDDLLDWILVRAHKVGAEKAITDLVNYVENSQVGVELIELVSSLGENNFEFSNGVKYLDMNTIYKDENCIGNSTFRNNLINRPLITPDFNKIGGLLSVEFNQPVIHEKSTESSNKINIDLPFEKIIFTKLCISLARPIRHGVFGSGSTVIASDNVPIFNSGQVWNISPSKPPSMSSGILEIEFKIADELLVNIELLDPEFRTKLLIPLGKLNDFGSGESMIERAIGLRICLESIFLNDGNKEQLRFRLALRTALFLGKDLEERKAISKTIKQAYDITSTAVHEGKFSAKSKTEILFKAANYAKQALIKLINEGEVNWEDMELS